MWNLINKFLPGHDSSQSSCESLVRSFSSRFAEKPVIVDVGCGKGDSVDFFRDVFSSFEWIGVDIEESPEVNSRTRNDALFLDFDGKSIPLPDKHADLVYCKQVLEHVRHPEILLKDINRILKDDGLLIGQTSHLEPYHSYQYWNFTPWGFAHILNDAGLKLIQIRPGIDGLTLVRRTYEGRARYLNKFFTEESPINSQIDCECNKNGESSRQANYKKLEIAGQFCFVVGK